MYLCPVDVRFALTNQLCLSGTETVVIAHYAENIEESIYAKSAISDMEMEVKEIRMPFKKC